MGFNKRRTFTPQQTALGILTTFQMGNYSLAITRLSAVRPLTRRDEVQKIVEAKLTKDELQTWRLYLRG